MITLRLFASLRDLVGKKEVHMEHEDTTLKELLEEFADRQGEKVRDFLFDREGRVWQSVLLLLNGEPVGKDLHTQVKSGDVISILLPTAGGGA